MFLRRTFCVVAVRGKTHATFDGGRKFSKATEKKKRGHEYRTTAGSPQVTMQGGVAKNHSRELIGHGLTAVQSFRLRGYCYLQCRRPIWGKKC